MKKIPMNAARLQLKREKVANLTPKESGDIKGGGTNTDGCPPESMPEPRYDIHTNFVGYVWVCFQGPRPTGAFC